jgi:hypothetical protein
VLAKIPDSRLRAYMVWVPVLRAGPLESSAANESVVLDDSRVTQYIDPSGAISLAYATVLNLPKPVRAWDVYFLFAPDVRWPEDSGTDGGEGKSKPPPSPTFWMHQLSGRVAPESQWLNGGELAGRVRSLLLQTNNRKSGSPLR